MPAKVSIIIPCYNEADTIEKAVTQLQSLHSPFEVEIIVVDDGSVDGSSEKLRDLSGVKVERHETNRGKGAAIATGAAKATGEVVVIQDADLEYDPEEIPDLVQPILRGECEIVYGSRFRGNVESMAFSHYVGNKILSFFTGLLYGVKVTDMMSGHKAFRTDVFRQFDLKSAGFGFEMEVTARALDQGYRIHEVPIRYSKRRFGKAKIRWRDGLKSMIQLFAYRFGRL